MEAPAWCGRDRLISVSATKPWHQSLKKSVFWGACISPRCEEPAWGGMLRRAHPQLLQRSAPSSWGIPLQPPQDMGPGTGCGFAWSSTTEGLQAPSALMHLFIAAYASGYNLEIILPESIKDLASNISTSFS